MIDIEVRRAPLETAYTHRCAMGLYHQTLDLASNPKHAKWLSPLLLLADAALCILIIWKIPCEL